jgi:hypothetical protein
MADLVATFLLVAALIQLGRSYTRLGEGLDAETLRLRQWLTAEYELRRCLGAAAARRNIEAASIYLQGNHPEASRAIGELAAETTADLDDAFFDAGIGDDCNDTTGLPLAGRVYREDNPALPGDWPNWRYGFRP